MTPKALKIFLNLPRGQRIWRIEGGWVQPLFSSDEALGSHTVHVHVVNLTEEFVDSHAGHFDIPGPKQTGSLGLNPDTLTG